MIEETDLGKAASEILMKNKYYLISNGVRGEVECPDFVYTDKKWIIFYTEPAYAEQCEI